MDEAPKIKLLSAGLNQIGDEIVAHGWLDLESLNLLKVDDYQREELGRLSGKKTSLQMAVEKGATLPDIMLGMRGQRYTTHGKSMILEDPVYIIDGLQRVCALKMAFDSTNGKLPTSTIGAEVRFDTTRESEKDLFNIFNTSRIKVSPNVILRNMRDQSRGILTLYGLSTTDRDFALYGRVSWNQRMKRGELVTALMLAKVAVRLHNVGSFGTGGRASSLAAGIDVLADKFGLATFRYNIETFYEVLDACWSIRATEYGSLSTHLRGNFMETVAMVFAKHEDFWKGKSLTVRADLRKRLATFPVDDPEIIRLAGSGSMAIMIMYNLLVAHLNHGKHKSNRLKLREETE